MAELNLIGGYFSGKCGKLQGEKRAGCAVVKSLTNKPDEKTPAQLAQRERFKQNQALVREIRDKIPEFINVDTQTVPEWNRLQQLCAPAIKDPENNIPTFSEGAINRKMTGNIDFYWRETFSQLKRSVTFYSSPQITVTPSLYKKDWYRWMSIIFYKDSRTKEKKAYISPIQQPHDEIPFFVFLTQKRGDNTDIADEVFPNAKFVYTYIFNAHDKNPKIIEQFVTVIDKPVIFKQQQSRNTL